MWSFQPTLGPWELRSKPFRSEETCAQQSDVSRLGRWWDNYQRHYCGPYIVIYVVLKKRVQKNTLFFQWKHLDFLSLLYVNSKLSVWIYFQFNPPRSKYIQKDSSRPKNIPLKKNGGKKILRTLKSLLRKYVIHLTRQGVVKWIRLIIWTIAQKS